MQMIFKDKIDFKYKFLVISLFGLLLTSFTRNSLYALVVFSVLAWVIIPLKLYWHKAFLFLMLFSVSYSLIMCVNGNVVSYFNVIALIVCPVIFFRLGYLVMDMYQTERTREKFFLLITIFFLSPIIYQTIVDIRLVGIVNPTRHLFSIFGNSSTMSATLYGLMSSVGIGCIASLFVKCSDIRIQFGYITMAVLSILIDIHLLCRTGIVLLSVCIFVSLILSSKMKPFRLISMLMTFFMCTYILMNTRLVSDEIVAAYQNRIEYSASNESAGGRVEFWYSTFQNMIVFPFGWKTIHYSHNMWFDIARVSGLLAFIPFSIFTIIYIKRLYLLMRKRQNQFNIIFISINISMLLASCVEPVIDASILFFALLMMIWGCVFKLSTESNDIIKRNN